MIACNQHNSTATKTTSCNQNFKCHKSQKFKNISIHSNFKSNKKKMPKHEIYKSKLPRSFEEVSFTLRDIKEYKSKYIGSKLERHDIKLAYEKYKGCFRHMGADILFMDHTSEPRIKNIINRMIRTGELPDYSSYTKGDAKSESQCRDVVCYKGNQSKGDRMSRGLCNLLKKYKPFKPKRRIPRKYLRPKAMKAITAPGDSSNKKSPIKSTVNFVGDIFKGLFK